MKKLLLSLMAVATLGVVQAKKVKFQVDMTGQTVSVNGVSVAGDFQTASGQGKDWTPGAGGLTQEGTTNIYSRVYDIPERAIYRFKFINGNDWDGANNSVESVPAISQKGHSNNGGGDDNRWFFNDSIADDTTVLAAILFSGSAPAGKYAVRLAVDMQKEASISANGVHIAGNAVMPNWTPAANNMANLFSNNKVYEYIAYVSAGTYAYKFVNGNAWGSDESVPSGCAVDNNRQVIVSTADIAATKVCYNSCVACPTAPIPTYSLTFQVDMSNSDCDGVYDSVTVAGAGPRLTKFGSGIKMMEIGTSKIFAITVDSLDSGEVNFKFRKHKNGNTGWEGGDNRILTLSEQDTVDLTCFGLRVVGNCVSKPAPSSITFKVDASNETIDKIYVMGTFQTPNWQSGALRMSPTPGQPGVFEVTVNNICPGTFNYKFVNGDSSNSAFEENFPDTANRGCVEPSGVGGWNRTYTRNAATPVTIYYVYNTCTAGSSVGINEVSLSNTFKVFPNPAQSYTMVEFNDNTSLHTIVLMDIAGKTIQSYTNYTQNSLLINTDELSKGLYFIKASNTRNESVTSKLIVR
jgi:mRNA-degrading endonuclease toxin of MazEF toxin-antitoxin module